MKQFQITCRCEKSENHAKVLRFAREFDREYVEVLAKLIDGSSPHYIYHPGANSPMGKCATCGGKLTAIVEEVEDAKPKS
jgi:hypothetical protein